MKSKIQGKSGIQILEIEKIFIASFQGADVLFVKPKAQKELALELPGNFMQKLISEVKKES